MSLRLVSNVVARRALAGPAVPKVLPFAARALLSTAAGKKHIIVNALGADRLGIVSDMTKLVTDAGGNVGESQAIKIGSHFSLTMLLSVPAENSDDLTASLSKLEGMSTQYCEAEDPEAVKVKAGIGYSGEFTLSGADNPGLCHKVTSLLAKHLLSIDVLETSHEEAPFGGTTLFRVEGIVTAPKQLPKSFNTDKIREELAALGDSINCDITLEDNIGRKKKAVADTWVNAA